MKIKLLILTFFFSVSSYSQCFDCGHSIGGHVEDYIVDTDKASDGIILTINPQMGWERAIYKYDFNCNLIWKNTFSPEIPTDRMILNHTSLDDNDNIYTILGNDRNAKTIDGFTIEKGNSLVKLNPNGAIEWVKHISDEHFLKIKVHTWMGNVYIVGQFEEGVNTNIGLAVQTGYGSQYFIAKYDVAGNLEMSRQYGENNNETLFDSQIDEKGNIYFTGVVLPRLYSSNTSSYLYKVDSNLKFLWSQELSSNSFDKAFKPMTLYYNNSNKKLYIWSKYYKTANFFNNIISVSNNGDVGSIIMEISGNNGELENYKIIDHCGFLNSVGNGTGNFVERGFMAHEGSNLYILSSFLGEITIGNQTINTTQIYPGSYNTDLILFKIDLTDFTPELILRSQGENYHYSSQPYRDLAGPIVAFNNSIYITSAFMSYPITLNGNTIENNSGNNNRDILFYKHLLDQDNSNNVIAVSNTCFSGTTNFAISGNFDSVLWNFNDPTSGVNNTSASSEATHIFTNPGIYEVSVVVSCGAETETINRTVTITNIPSVYQINNLYSCEDEFGSQISTSFDTSSIEKTLIGDQVDLSIHYFDQNGKELPNPLPNPMANTVSAKEKITARVSYLNNPTCYTETSFDLIVQSAPQIFPVDTIYECDRDDDGFTLFDLSQLGSHLIGNQPNFNLQFYDSNNNLIPANVLVSYINKKANEDFITGRATNITNSCYSETTIHLIVNPLPTAYPLNTLMGCDDDNDGISEYFDLSGVEAEVLQDQAGLQVSYFRRDGSEITGMTSFYTNLQPNEENLTVRVSHPGTGCYAETSLILRTSAAPALQSPISGYSCDEGDGFGHFDTSSWTQNIIGNQSGLKVTYFSQNGNPLPNPLPAHYQNTVPFAEKITVKVENEQNSLCASETSFDLIINKKQELVMEEIYNLCDLEPFLLLKPGGNFDAWVWKDSSGTTVSNTAEASLADAGNYSVTVTSSENGVECESSHSFRLVRSQLPTITEVKYQEWSSSNFLEIMTGGDGDLEFSIDGENFQDSNYFGNLPGGIYTVFARDKLGCGMASTEVIIVDYPKHFSPNNDGVHDYWQIKGISPQVNINILIYDRYGKILDEISSQSHGWDGTFNGRSMPSDDYWFSISLQDGRIFKGHFSLVR